MVLVFLSPSPTCISVRSISSDSRELPMQHSKKGWCPRYAHVNIVSLVRDTRHTVWVSGRVATESPADGDTVSYCVLLPGEESSTGVSSPADV